MKLKKSSLEAVEQATEKKEGGAYIAERFRAPSLDAGKKSSGAGEKIGAVLAIVSVVLLGIICAMLYVNWDLLQNA